MSPINKDKLQGILDVARCFEGPGAPPQDSIKYYSAVSRGLALGPYRTPSFRGSRPPNVLSFDANETTGSERHGGSREHYVSITIPIASAIL